VLIYFGDLSNAKHIIWSLKPKIKLNENRESDQPDELVKNKTILYHLE
jgi:hypothetical protein